MEKMGLVAATLLILLQISRGMADVKMSGLVGEPISLPCEINRDGCGDLHSIRWYKDGRRVYVFSELAIVSKAENDLEDRAQLIYDVNATVTKLDIRPLNTTDEGTYKCDITYLNVRDKCAVAQFIWLETLAAPKSVNISLADGGLLQNASLLGPFNEGTPLSLLCESGGGKPVAKLSWWNGTEEVAGQYSAEEEEDLTGIGRSLLSVTLTRGDLGAKLECQSMNDALDRPLRAWVEVDVLVRPLSVELSGLEEHLEQGDTVNIRCHVKGARPQANITWLNDSSPWPNHVNSHLAVQQQQPPSTTVYETTDGTYETQSLLTFNATRFENGQTITCEATNQVMQDSEEEPMRSSVTLQVLYPPAVIVTPSNITVNESTTIHLYCRYDANPLELSSVKWYRDQKELELDSAKYEGGTLDNPSLTIKNASRDDQGSYKCRLHNQVGMGESDNLAFVTVFYRPTVRLTMEPAPPVNEVEHLNITLTCDVEEGNPDYLIAVRWYLQGDLLQELPECNINDTMFGSQNDLCDIDPSKLLLESVGRKFQGNYSCEGKNEAGWGARSADEELIVKYPPSQAYLSYEPQPVVKGKSVNLTCTVEDLGRPESTSFRWMRGNRVINDITTAEYVIFPVTLETMSNFSCRAVNEVGAGESATVDIEVLAPPAFIDRLPPYHGALMNSEGIGISCRVECFPMCKLEWLKNGKVLKNSSHYTIMNNQLQADPRTSDFMSVVSILKWNMSAWPNHQLDRVYDNANYTCQSTSTVVGPGVSSTTYFRVEYPPENISISLTSLNVMEGAIPERVVCNAKAYPEAIYMWQFKNEIIYTGEVLFLDYPMMRDKDGEYHCIAQNRHGNISAKTYINVLFKPECSITQEKKENNLVLRCEVMATPKVVDFSWTMNNHTREDNIESVGLESFLTLKSNSDYYGTYYCSANNSVGTSIPCEIDITGMSGFLDKLGDNSIIMIGIIIGGAVLMLLIVCVLIIVVCRRRRAEDKSASPSSQNGKPSKQEASLNKDHTQPDADNAFYENLPFHGMQAAPNKPYRPQYSDLDYADVDYKSYGPINYKQASVIAAQQKQSQPEGVPARPPRNI